MIELFGMFCVLITIVTVITFSFLQKEEFSQIDGLKKMWSQKPKTRLGQWKNNIPIENGYCGPKWNDVEDKNTHVRCVDNMKPQDCCHLNTMGQVCGVNKNTGETYSCNFYPGKLSDKCSSINSQY